MRKLVAVIAVMGMGLASAAMAQADVEPANTCAPYVGLELRGTNGSVTGSGYPGQVIRDVQRASSRRVSAYELPYPATSGNGSYFPSVAKGVQKLHRYLTNDCLSSKVILVGYSQGAEVVSRELAEYPVTPWIVAIVVMGNPTFHTPEPWDRGTYMRGTGLEGSHARDVSAARIARYRGLIGDWCDDDDLVCQATGQGSLHHHGRGHHSYPMRVAAMTHFILRTLRRAPSTGTPDPTSGCPDAIGVAVRSTGDAPGGGRIAGPVVAQVRSAPALSGQTVAEHDLTYPAAPPPGYRSSRIAGDRALRHFLSSEAARCRNARFFLVGAGQGAQVIAQELHVLTEHPAPFSTRIAAVVLNGNPAFNGHAAGQDRGSYTPGVDGLLVANVGSTAAFSKVTGSWCNGDDRVCQRGAHGDGHAQYARYRSREVAFVVGKLTGQPTRATKAGPARQARRTAGHRRHRIAAGHRGRAGRHHRHHRHA